MRNFMLRLKDFEMHFSQFDDVLSNKVAKIIALTRKETVIKEINRKILEASFEADKQESDAQFQIATSNILQLCSLLAFTKMHADLLKHPLASDVRKLPDGLFFKLKISEKPMEVRIEKIEGQTMSRLILAKPLPEIDNNEDTLQKVSSRVRVALSYTIEMLIANIVMRYQYLQLMEFHEGF